jgi:drug/metabolite transporter (DMT)-like permease
MKNKYTYKEDPLKLTLLKTEKFDFEEINDNNKDKNNNIHFFHPDRIRSEREKLFVSFITNFLYAMSNLSTKFISKYYPDSDPNTTSFYRFISVYILTIIYVYQNKIKISKLSEVKSKGILLIRIFSAYGIALFLNISVKYLRLGVVNSFFFISPIFTGIASIYFFKDKCTTRSILGLFLCLFSMFLITLSEKSIINDNNNINNEKNINYGLGMFSGLGITFSTVAMITATKKLVSEMDSISINYRVGEICSLIGFVICVYSGSLFYLKIGYIFLTFLNGALFWCAIYVMNLSLKINNLIAVNCIGYLTLVYAFGFGIIFFDEPLRFIDFLASLIIFSFNLYSVIIPEKKED